MPIRVEAYTAEGIATGIVAGPGPLRDVLDGNTGLTIERATWMPLDGSPERPAGELLLAVDDLLLVVPDDVDSVPVHAQWHDVDLDAGPYRVHGEMPTMPGFDPGRALARPTGEFVLLRDATIRLVDEPDAGEASAPALLVNRYTVDHIAADLMLGFFFPGATMAITGGTATAAAPVGAAAPDATASTAAAEPDTVASSPG